jgi:acyl-CoA synthetase (AMP-forming)/AMP-acid ligase II
MNGLMMEMPLLVSSLIEHADRHHGDVEMVSRRVEGDIHRQTYREAHARAKQLANALIRMGAKPGDRIASLAWNGYRHFELFYAVGGAGMVMHTLNPRLFPEQIAWIMNDAEDTWLFFDATFLPLVEKLKPALKSLRHLVLMTDRAHMPKEAALQGLLCYEELLAAEKPDYRWPLLDENTACGLCYTSGTTGNPKGALYSNRSNVLLAYATCMADVMALSGSDVVLPVVPMFHANTWGLQYAAPMVGAKMVLPGPGLDGKSLCELFEAEKVTITAGVPTVWMGMLQHVRQTGARLSTLQRAVVGGSACPPAMMEAFEKELGVQLFHAWGMTEMSPLGSFCRLRQKHLDLPPAEQREILLKQGRVPYGVDWKIVDGEGRELPWDGKAFGDLYVRGPWVVRDYYKGKGSSADSPSPSESSGPLRDGWFPTGDVATIDPDGYMQITDRSKDVIKSGGEWISSIDLENTAVAHPAILEAAVIGCAHPKWAERPLLVVVKKPGAEVTREELLAHFEGKVAKWWIPDDVVFVTDIPHTATGKISKTKLRENYREHRLPTA